MVSISSTSIVAIGLIVATTASTAHAVSARVKFACAKDYYAHCSMHKPDTPEVRSCMRAAGLKLSPRCFNALAAAGEVSQKDMATRAASVGN